MFNSKRIIFLIGLLSIVALTGALMAGPAFAGKGGNGNGNGNAGAGHQTEICHYNGYESDDVLTLDVDEEMAGYWEVKFVDAMSVDTHEANHGWNGYSDQTMDSFTVETAACTNEARGFERVPA